MSEALNDTDRAWFAKENQKSRLFALYELIREMGNETDVEEAKAALLPIGKRVMNRL